MELKLAMQIFIGFESSEVDRKLELTGFLRRLYKRDSQGSIGFCNAMAM